VSALLLSCRLVKAEEIPAKAESGFTEPLRLVSVLADDDVLKLVADAEAFDALRDMPQLAELLLELRQSKVSLANLGGRGTAYRLRVIGVRKGRAS